MKNCDNELKKLKIFDNSKFLENSILDNFETSGTTNNSECTSYLYRIEKALQRLVDMLQTYSYIKNENNFCKKKWITELNKNSLKYEI